MKKNAFVLSLVVVVFCLTSIGCNKGGIQRCAVSGTVTVDGKPVESGAISFHPLEGPQSPSTGGKISNGTFDILKKDGPAPGKYQLELAGSMKTGNMIDVPGSGGAQKMEELVQAIPKKNAYPSGSEIPEVEIKAGKNELNIELSSEE